MADGPSGAVLPAGATAPRGRRRRSAVVVDRETRDGHLAVDVDAQHQAKADQAVIIAVPP